MKGVWPSWVMQSSLSPVQSPRPSNTAKAAGDPSVHSLHSARIDASLVGSKLTMIGLIVRPLTPPVLLICLTKSLMAFVCSPNSASWANPSCPANELSDTTGKTTLILDLVTPLDDVLAVVTELGPLVDARVVVGPAPSGGATTLVPPSSRLPALGDVAPTCRGDEAGPDSAA